MNKFSITHSTYASRVKYVYYVTNKSPIRKNIYHPYLQLLTNPKFIGCGDNLLILTNKQKMMDKKKTILHHKILLTKPNSI